MALTFSPSKPFDLFQAAIPNEAAPTVPERKAILFAPSAKALLWLTFTPYSLFIFLAKEPLIRSLPNLAWLKVVLVNSNKNDTNSFSIAILDKYLSEGDIRS